MNPTKDQIRAALNAFDTAPQIKRTYDPPQYEMRLILADEGYHAVRAVLQSALDAPDHVADADNMITS